LTSPDFNPRRQVFLPPEARSVITATNPATAGITSAHFAAHKISLELNAASSALVVLAQTTFPAWRAYVDNQPVKLWRANHAFQALEVPSGRHHVRLVFRDWYFYYGAIISALTLAGCVVFGM